MRVSWGWRSTGAVAAAAVVLAGCGGGDEPAAGGGGAAGFTATCNTAGYVAGSVELPTVAQLAAYAATYNGDEGSYDMGGTFTKSGSAALGVAADGRVTYKGTAYDPSSVCIDKVAGPVGKVLYLVVGTAGHFDVADKVDAVLGQAWGVSPVNGTTIFTNGRK